MKKKLLILAASFTLSTITFAQEALLDTNGSLIERLELTPIKNDTLINNVAINVVESLEVAADQSRANDSLIVKNVDLVAQAVSQVIPQAAPFTGLIGIVVSALGMFFVRRKWKRKHDKLKASQNS